MMNLIVRFCPAMLALVNDKKKQLRIDEQSEVSK